MFQSFAWNYTAACRFGERLTPHVILVESGEGMAIIPAALNSERLTLLGEELFDYRDVLHAGDAGALNSAWRSAAALNLPFSAGALRADADLRLWNGFTRNPFYAAPLVRAAHIDPKTYAREHGRLGRWSRRLAREGCSFRCYSGANWELVRLIYEKKGSQPAETGDSLFSDPLRVDFMVDVCRTVSSACEIFTCESAGRLVAALVTFRDGNARRFYTIYFDQAWSKYSPGMVLVYDVTRQTLEAGMDCDYMTGEHGYKMRFATDVVPMYWVEGSATALAEMAQRPSLIAA